MDQREHQLQSLSICNRLYNFVLKGLTTHAFKTVLLGRPRNRDLAKAQNGSAHNSHQMVQIKAQEETTGEGIEQTNNLKNLDPSAPLGSSSNDHKQNGRELPTVQDKDADNINEEKSDKYVTPGTGPEEEAPLPSLDLQAKPPKKAVSINDRVVEIDTSKKKIKKKKSSEKLTPLEREEDEPKPLKSILKVGSDLGEKSNSFVDSTNDVVKIG